MPQAMFRVSHVDIPNSRLLLVAARSAEVPELHEAERAEMAAVDNMVFDTTPLVVSMTSVDGVTEGDYFLVRVDKA